MKFLRNCIFSSIFLLCIFSFQKIDIFASDHAVSIQYHVDENIHVGDIFEIKVNISEVNDLYGASLDFSYDNSLFKIVEISKGDAFTDTSLVVVNSIKEDMASIVATEVSNQRLDTKKGTLFTIKAKALKEGSMILKTIDSNMDISSDKNNIRIKLSDSNAQKIGFNVKDKELKIYSSQNNLTALPVGTHEETHKDIVYTGNWTSISNSQYSDGAVLASEDKGDTIEFKFNGTGFEWYGHVNDWRGKAEVYIDGILDHTVDQYSKVSNPNKLVYSKEGLTNGEHTVKIVVLGTKSDESKGKKVTLDKVVIKKTDVVIPVLPVGTHEETHKDIVYTGSWTSISNSQYSDGAVLASEDKGDTIEFKFNGTGFEWYGHVNDWRGKAEVYIDGILDHTVDQYSKVSNPNKLVYSKEGLTNGEHTVKIVVLGTKSDESKGKKVTLDKVVIKG
ncbi:cohesin domain-containing protein, partial [Turicibacter sanguinis]|uniref:cohesin domain-containing protein n=2 Tax=Turicibacter sanguinis TaxID=154288 RepID=UPI001E396FFA